MSPAATWCKECSAYGRVLLLVVACVVCSCKSATPPPRTPARPAALGPAYQFEFEALDGSSITAQGTRGRNTVIGFITTYDLASQALANFLKTIAREHVPRTNVLAIVLERAESAPLVRAYVDVLQLRFPVVLLDPAEQPSTAFKDSKSVPSVVVLDREGRPVWQKNGIVEAKEIDRVLRTIE